MSGAVSKYEVPSEFKIQVGRVHLSSLQVKTHLNSGCKQLDELLLSFASELLSNLLHPKKLNMNLLEGSHSHGVHIGYPYEDDVASCAPV